MELRNYLYESLLSDEEELVSRGDDNVIKTLADKVFKINNFIYHRIEKNGLVSYDGILSLISPTSIEIVKKIFSGEYFTEYERLANLEIQGSICDKIFDVITTPITINKINYFYIMTESLTNVKPGYINIKEIDTFEIVINNENPINWQDHFKNTRIKEMYIDTLAYAKEFNNNEEIVNLSGLTIDNLIINDYAFKDKTRILKDVDIILANNNIKHIYIHNMHEKSRVKFNGKTMKVQKIK